MVEKRVSYPTYPSPDMLGNYPGQKSSKKWVWISLILILLLIAIAGASYYFYKLYEKREAERAFLIGTLTELKCFSLCSYETNYLYNASDKKSFSYQSYSNPGCIEHCIESTKPLLDKAYSSSDVIMADYWPNESLGWNLDQYAGICLINIYYFKQDFFIRDSSNYRLKLDERPIIKTINREFCDSLISKQEIIDLSNYKLGNYDKYNLQITNVSCTRDNLRLTLKWDTQSVKMTELAFKPLVEDIQARQVEGTEQKQPPLAAGETREFLLVLPSNQQNNLSKALTYIKYVIAPNNIKTYQIACNL